MRTFVFVIAFVCFTQSARADNNHTHLLLSVGAMDAQLYHSGEQSIRLGPYATVDLKAVKHLTERFMITFGGGVDIGLTGHQWGIAAFGGIEYKIWEWFRVDFSIIGMFDKDKHPDFFAGAGPGLTFKLHKRFFIEFTFPFLACLKTPGGLLFASSVAFAYRFDL